MDGAIFPILAGVLGLIVGSFLNVVIYRLPRDELSITRPLWSFCPACTRRILARDNVPVLSWLLLRGRCRFCSSPISLQYPLIEALTAVVFVAVFDALFVGRTRAELPVTAAGVPMLIACWVLLASLLANSVMDVEEYIIDLRLTYFAIGVAVVAHATHLAMSPVSDEINSAVRPSLAAGAAGLAWIVMAPLVARRDRASHEQGALHESAGLGDGEIVEQEAQAQTEGPGTDPVGGESAVAPEPGDGGGNHERSAVAGNVFHPVPIVLLFVVLVVLAVATLTETASDGPLWGMTFRVRAIATLAVLVFVLILAAMQSRPADAEIVAMLEEERPRARRVALNELVFLLPMIAAATAAYLAARQWIVADDWRGLLGEQPGAGWRLAMGALHGALGCITAAALGWGVRIFFTLLFGKEAFGTGDIHLMAAIGAVGGLWMCLIAFFAASLLALLGVAATLFRKSARAIPFGPWLGVGTLVGLWTHDSVVEVARPAMNEIWRMLTAAY